MSITDGISKYIDITENDPGNVLGHRSIDTVRHLQGDTDFIWPHCPRISLSLFSEHLHINIRRCIWLPLLQNVLNIFTEHT